MLKPDFLMRHTATLRRFLGQGVSGPRYGEAETLRCCLSYKRELTWRQNQNAGDEIIASGKAYFPSGTRLDVQDELTINGRRYVILSCQPRYDWMGAENHVEVSLQ